MLSAACFFASAPAALAAFGLSDVSARPASANAGANSDFAVSFDVTDPESGLKKLVVHLPPGLVGNPLATPTCSEPRLKADDCPPASDVGDVSNDVTVYTNPLVGAPLMVRGQVYNVKPRAGEPARFGMVLRAAGELTDPIILQLPASLRPGDFGLDTTLDNIPRKASGFRIDVNAVALTFDGKAGSPPQGFLRNPTSCGTNLVRFDVDAYDSSTATAKTSFQTKNCDRLPFTPEFSAEIVPAKNPDEPVAVSTTIAQTVEEAGLRRAVVTLPAELTPNTTQFLIQCPEANFLAGTCPENTKVGDAVATSPFQAQALKGPVFLVSPTAGGIAQIGVELKGALALKLLGDVGVVPVPPTGIRSSVTFDGLPDIPISEFTLSFTGGPDGLNRATRDPCRPPPFIFDTAFDAHSGKAESLRIRAKARCGGGGGGVKPRATVKLKRLGSGKPKLRLTARSGSRPLAKTRLQLPRRLKFAGGRKFERGVTAKADGEELRGGAIKHRRRSLTVKTGFGAKVVTLRAAKGALKAKRRAGPKRRLSFGVAIRDTEGKRTALSVRPK